MSVKISSLNTASTIDSGDDINIAGNNPLTFSDWGGGWFMQDGTYIRSYNQKSIWLGSGVLASQGGLSVGYGGASPSSGGAIIAGNVGIGITNPNAKLQIAGTTGNLLTVGTLTNDWVGNVAIGIENGNGVILSKINAANDSNRVLVFLRDDTNGASIIGYTPTGGSTNVGFNIRANATSYFNGGNVGIGTTSPAYTLDVNGTARVSGTLTINNGYTNYQYGGSNYYATGLGFSSNYNYSIYNTNYGREDLKIEQATGAATFSSSVFAGGILNTSDRLYINGQTTPSNWISSALTMGYNTSGTQGWIQGAGSLALGVNGTSHLKIESGGAATFSSSVTATNFIGAGTGLTGTASALSIGGNAAYATTAGSLTSMNISQFTNNSGYITSGALADYLPLAAGISYPLTGTLYGVGASFSSGVTASSLGATSVSSSTGFIATAAGGGLRNDFYDVRFYPSAGNIWNITGATLGGSSFALRFLDAYNAGSGAVKAQIFWSASNVGLFNDQNDWVIKANQGSSFGGTLYGAWIVTGSITAAANSVISGAVNSAYGLSVTNTGTTNAAGLYVNLGASATGVPFRVDKNGSALFDLTNAGNATIKGALTISGSNLYINSSAADISSRYNNGTNNYGWLLSTGTGNFSLFDYNSEAVYMQINPSTFSSNFYYANFNINVSNTSGGSITFKAAAAANNWSISKNDTTGLSINKNGVSQLGISATGATTLIGSLSVTGDYISVGSKGLYSSTDIAYFRRNDVSNFCPWLIDGAKSGNDYKGTLYNVTNLPHMMFNATGGGLYYQTGGRWVIYYDYTANCLAIGGSGVDATYKLRVTGAIYATGAIVANSDGRNKENVEVVENALEKVTNLRGVTYTKKDEDSGRREMGVIAQEVEPHVPEVVHYSKGVDVYGVSYGNFAGLFIEAIKEQQVLINELKAEIEILKNK